MHAAFGLALAAPASGARILARPHGRRAGQAADGKIILRDKRMRRQIVRLEISFDVVVRPGRERVELDTRAVALEERQRRARRRLEAFAPGDPGVVILERLRQRLDLADRAAAVRVARPKEVFGIFPGASTWTAPSVSISGARAFRG